MLIKENTVVRFHYRLSEVTEEGNQFLEQSQGEEAMAYLHGKGAIIAGMEKSNGRQAAG